jgi:hypothetical protein
MMTFTRRALLAATTVAGIASAQQTIGTDVCSCSPSSYVFSFNFSGTCEGSSLKTGQPGLNETGCLVNGKGKDQVPVSLSSVLIADLDQNLQTVVSGQQANLTSSDKIVYDAFTKTANVSAALSSEIPRGVALIMKGENAAGEDIQMSIAIIFTQECDTYPIIAAGDSVGWLVIVSSTPNKNAMKRKCVACCLLPADTLFWNPLHRVRSHIITNQTFFLFYVVGSDCATGGFLPRLGRASSSAITGGRTGHLCMSSGYVYARIGSQWKLRYR